MELQCIEEACNDAMFVGNTIKIKYLEYPNMDYVVEHDLSFAYLKEKYSTKTISMK